jgi:hypothetical protein
MTNSKTTGTGSESKNKRRPSRVRRIGGVIALTVLAVAAVFGGILWSNVNKIGGIGGASSVIGSLRDPKAQFPRQRSSHYSADRQRLLVHVDK